MILRGGRRWNSPRGRKRNDMVAGCIFQCGGHDFQHGCSGFPARWLPVKVLRSRNKYRGFVADIMGKKKIILVFQMGIYGGRKVREKVVV